MKGEGCQMHKKQGRSRRKWWVLVGFCLILFLVGPTVQAEERDEVTGAAGFTYSLSFPDNQMKDNIGYYHLKMSSGQKQTVQITLSNPGSEAVTVLVDINGAKTNQNGVIEYGESTIDNDASLKFPFETLVTGPETVELQGGETKQVELTIQMPDTSIDGLIAGGIQLMRADQGEEIPSEGGSRIVNQYAYVVAMLLQEKDTVPAPDLSLNQVYAGQANYRNTIFIDFSNIMPAFLNDMTVETQINAKGNSAVLYERKQTAMRMAPNTFIDFPVSMNGERMVSGTYVANILVTSGDQRWAWTEEFEITVEDAEKFNERDVGLVQERGMNWWLIVLIVIGIMGLIGGIYGGLLFHRKQKEKKKSLLRTKKQGKGSNKEKNSRKNETKQIKNTREK